MDPFFTRLFSRPTGTRNQHEQNNNETSQPDQDKGEDYGYGKGGSDLNAWPCKLSMSSFCFSICRAAQALEMASIQTTATSILQITPMSCHVMQTDSRCLGRSHLLSPLGALPPSATIPRVKWEECSPSPSRGQDKGSG